MSKESLKMQEIFSFWNIIEYPKNINPICPECSSVCTETPGRGNTLNIPVLTACCHEQACFKCITNHKKCSKCNEPLKGIFTKKFTDLCTEHNYIPIRYKDYTITYYNLE